MIARAIARGGAVEIRGSSTAGRTLVRVRVRGGSGRVLSASWCARRRADARRSSRPRNPTVGRELRTRIWTKSSALRLMMRSTVLALPIPDRRISNAHRILIACPSLSSGPHRPAPTGAVSSESATRSRGTRSGTMEDAMMQVRARGRARALPRRPRAALSGARSRRLTFFLPVSPRWRDLTSSGLAPPLPPPRFRSK